MGFVLSSAVALAALRNANPFWGGALLLLATALVGVAVLGLIQGRGSARAWWLGYALFSGGYLALVFGPGLSGSIGVKLATTEALDYVHSLSSSPPEQPTLTLQKLQVIRTALTRKFENHRRLVRNSNDPALTTLKRQLAAVDDEIDAVTDTSPVTPNRWRTLIPATVNYEPFLRVGHALFALVAGWVGAVISCRLHARNEGRPPAEPATPT